MDIKYAYYNTSKGYRVVGGTAAQFLKADGSLDGKEYIDKYTEQNIESLKWFHNRTGTNGFYETSLIVAGWNGSKAGISFFSSGMDIGSMQFDGYFNFRVESGSGDYTYTKAAGYVKNGSSNNHFLTGDGGDYDSRKKEDSYIHSSRNFTDGTFIETDVDYSVTYGDQFLLEMKGNMYSNGNYLPLDFKLQGYIYSDTIISEGGYSTLFYFNYIIALNFNGKLAFWFPRLGYWQGFDVKLTVGYGGSDQGRNRVTSVSDNIDPGGTKRVQINLKHLLTKEELISENTFWEKKDIGGYWALDSNKPIAGLNGSGAQVILSGGLLASASYTDSQFIPTDGIHSRGFVQSDEGFWNRYWKADQRNRIWSFANSDNHGISYFQGNGHVLGEGINFHFGDTSSTGYKFYVQNSGRVFSAVDGNSGDWKHKDYNANNYLGADYIGGGQEKPNSAYFGAGKLKLQMLEATQMGTSNFGWSDVLWMSSYTGSDVKKSTAIVSSKYNDRIGFVKQNYDAADWGTFQEFWTTNNLTNPASHADLENYYHINEGGISNQSELVPNGLQSISTGNSGSDFDGELSNKTLEGTFASFNGYSKASKDLGFTLFAPTSKDQGVYYKTWYGGNQTPWKRLAEYSDLSGYVQKWENAHAVGFSSGLSTAAPYIYHSADGYVFLATQSWVTNNFTTPSFLAQNYALRSGSNATDTWVNAANGITNNPFIPGKIKNASGDSDLMNATYGNVLGMINTASMANGNPTDDWWFRIKMLHNNSSGYYAEIGVKMTGGTNSLRYKRFENGTNGDWVEVWDKANLSPGSISNWNSAYNNILKDVLNHGSNEGDYTRYYRQDGSAFDRLRIGTSIVDSRVQGNGLGSDGSSTFIPNSRNTDLNHKLLPLFHEVAGRGYQSSLILKGWTDSYRAWRITGPADVSTTEQDFYVSQTSSDTGKWMPERKIWTSKDFSQSHINAWNNLTNGIILNQEFSYNTGAGLSIVDDQFGGESGLGDTQHKALVAGKIGEYYKYGSIYDGLQGINYHVKKQNIGIGGDADADNKVRVEGCVKAIQNFKSEEELSDTMFIPNGRLATLRDEIINDEKDKDYTIRLDPHEYNVDSSGYLEVDDRNRLIHILGEQYEMAVNLRDVYPKQQIVIYNLNKSGNPMVLYIQNKPMYKIDPGCFLRLYVTESRRVIAEKQLPCEIIW